jgi:hypothetical protein
VCGDPYQHYGDTSFYQRSPGALQATYSAGATINVQWWIQVIHSLEVDSVWHMRLTSFCGSMSLSVPHDDHQTTSHCTSFTSTSTVTHGSCCCLFAGEPRRPHWCEALQQEGQHRPGLLQPVPAAAVRQRANLVHNVACMAQQEKSTPLSPMP